MDYEQHESIIYEDDKNMIFFVSFSWLIQKIYVCRK